VTFRIDPALVSLARLDGVLPPGLDVGPRPGRLLAHLRPRRVAVGGHDVRATVSGLVDLKVLRPLALDQQPLAMHFLDVLVDTLSYTLLLHSGGVSALPRCRPAVDVSPMLPYTLWLSEYSAAMVGVDLIHQSVLVHGQLIDRLNNLAGHL
jgi:hypothetical protein